MTRFKESEPASPAVISRRDAIVGALALAAGSLLAAKPDAALAADGQTLTAGGLVYTSQETLLHLTSTANDQSPILSSAIFNRYGTTSNGLVHAVSGAVQNVAAAGSVGVAGEAWASGLTGVQAQNHHAGGTALKVIGKAQFSRSGKGAIPKGKSVLTITGLANIETTSMILVTLQNSGGSGVYLKYAQRVSATSFKVSLSKACTSAVAFAWMIID